MLPALVRERTLREDEAIGAPTIENGATTRAKPITLSRLPIRTAERRDREEPREAISVIENLLPALACVRVDKDDPSVKKLITESLSPRDLPKTDRPEARRATDRSEQVEAKERWSRTERVLLSLAPERTEREEPRLVCVITESVRSEPVRNAPKRDNPEPIRRQFRSDTELPKSRCESVEIVFPRQVVDRIERLDPRVKQSKAEMPEAALTHALTLTDDPKVAN